MVLMFVERPQLRMAITTNCCNGPSREVLKRSHFGILHESWCTRSRTGSLIHVGEIHDRLWMGNALIEMEVQSLWRTIVRGVVHLPPICIWNAKLDCNATNNHLLGHILTDDLQGTIFPEFITEQTDHSSV